MPLEPRQKPTLKGERITLKPLDEHAVDAGYLNWMNDKETVRFLEARHKTWDKEDLINYISAMNNSGKEWFFGIFTEQNKYIGNIKLGPVEAPHDRASIGFMIGDKTARGKGYATEAVRIISQFAFNDLRLHKLTAGCYATNKASEALLINAGFAVEGRLKNHVVDDANQRDDVVLLGWVRP